MQQSHYFLLQHGKNHGKSILLALVFERFEINDGPCCFDYMKTFSLGVLQSHHEVLCCDLAHVLEMRYFISIFSI